LLARAASTAGVVEASLRLTTLNTPPYRPTRPPLAPACRLQTDPEPPQFLRLCLRRSWNRLLQEKIDTLATSPSSDPAERALAPLPPAERSPRRVPGARCRSLMGGASRTVVAEAGAPDASPCASSALRPLLHSLGGQRGAVRTACGRVDEQTGPADGGGRDHDAARCGRSLVALERRCRALLADSSGSPLPGRGLRRRKEPGARGNPAHEMEGGCCGCCRLGHQRRWLVT
jgi:hypothetical protein